MDRRHLLKVGGASLAMTAAAPLSLFDPRVARKAIAGLGVPDARILATAEAAGHVGAGGIPIAVADALASGRVRRGDLVCCSAFGAGMSWGAAIVEL